MGVADNINGDQCNMQIIHNELRVIENQINDETPNSPRRFHKKRRPFSVVNDRSTPSPKRGQGVRQMRRTENLRFLLELNGKEEILEVDLMEPGMSAFGDLLTDEEKMKVWNDFINHTEAEQQKFLQTLHYTGEEEELQGEEKKDKNAQDLSKIYEKLKDKRIVHPAFSAKECFKRIDSRLQSILRNKHTPKGMLQYIEEDVTSFFTDWPDSVYVLHLKGSLERMMLHAVCQYMDLYSWSYDDGGARHTQVENQVNQFLPPEVSLCSYLNEL